MTRSTDGGGATPLRDTSQGPQCPCPESTTVAPFETGARPRASVKRGGPAANSPMSELANLMEEPPGGPNHGRRASTNPEVEGSHVPLGPDDWQAAEFMRAGGWSVVTANERGWAAGMHAHRGVLQEDEYVDTDSLREALEASLGFTCEQVHAVYRQGPLSSEARQLRGAIDARVLALSRAGANIALLGRALGFPVKDNGNCRAMENALARARAKEA